MSYFHKKKKTPYPTPGGLAPWDSRLGLPRYHGVRANASLNAKQLQSRWSRYDFYCNLNCTRR